MYMEVASVFVSSKQGEVADDIITITTFGLDHDNVYLDIPGSPATHEIADAQIELFKL